MFTVHTTQIITKMVLLLLIFIQQIWGQNMTDEELREAMKTEIKENLHKGTPNVLLTLGDTIKDGLLHPTNDRNHGMDVLKALHEYYNHLNDVYLSMTGKEEIDKKLGRVLFRMLMEAGGPPFLNLEFDIEDAMEKFQWNNKAVYAVREIIDDTDALWEKILIESDTLGTSLK